MTGTYAAFTIVAATAVATVAALIVSFLPSPQTIWGNAVSLLAAAMGAVVAMDLGGRLAGLYSRRPHRVRRLLRRLVSALPTVHHRTTTGGHR